MSVAAASDVAERFRSLGLVIIDDYIEPTLAQTWGEALALSPLLRHIKTAEADRVVDAGAGDNEHYSLDAPQTDQTVAEISSVYAAIFEEFIAPLNPYAIVSPYERSRYYVKVYRNGCGQGWHYDTNTYSAILYLSSTTAPSGVTEVIARDGETYRVAPQAGRLLLLDGRHCWHCARPVHDETKVTVLLNYYDKGHRPRDLNTDPLIFGD